MALLPTDSGAVQREWKPRLTWASGVLVLVFLTLLTRLYQLQILHGDEYREKAEENFVKELRLPADRGQLLDRRGKVLVDSRPSFDVTLTPYFCARQCGEVLDRLTTLLAMSPEEVERSRGLLAAARKLERFRPFTVKVDVRREELDVIEAAGADLPGVDVQPVPHRSYRYGQVGGHLIGYMNEVGAEEQKRLNEELGRTGSAQGPYLLGDYVGRRGLERRWERELRGVDGKRRIAVDAKGREKSGDLIAEENRLVPARPGNNLVLSLDWRLQELAEKTFPATAGTVLAMDAKTGFLLALVSRPSPDPNKMSGRITAAELATIREDPLQPELFRAVQQHYHPGSTFKAVTAIATLEEGIFRPDTLVSCPGSFRMGSARWRCDKESGHGMVDFTHALGASCDVFFYQAGAQLGADLIAKWGRRLGLGAPTGLDVTTEVPGTIPDEAWHDEHLAGGYQRGMAVNLAIGQGDVNVTPVQQLVFYGALATGVLWRPQVVLRIEDSAGQVVKQFAPQERGRVDLKPSTRETVLKGLLAAVNEPYGTGARLRTDAYAIAGKTGTAQVVKLGAARLRADQVGYFQRDHAWFAAFAPADDPQIVVVVLNEHSGFGAANAAPTAGALLKAYFDLKAQDEAERAGAAGRPGLGTPPAAAPRPPAPAGPSDRPPERAGRPVLGAGPDGAGRGHGG